MVITTDSYKESIRPYSHPGRLASEMGPAGLLATAKLWWLAGWGPIRLAGKHAWLAGRQSPARLSTRGSRGILGASAPGAIMIDRPLPTSYGVLGFPAAGRAGHQDIKPVGREIGRHRKFSTAVRCLVVRFAPTTQ